MKKLILTALLIPVLAAAQTDVIYTDSTTRSTVDTKADTTTTLKSPPPSAITPTMNISNSDLCTVGVAGAVQTQILGISAGKTVRDMNCERLKMARELYVMGMKVAAVSTLCQDKRIFDAMMNAGTPCPYDGLIGAEAKAAWAADEALKPEEEDEGMDKGSQTLLGGAGIAGLLLALLAL